MPPELAAASASHAQGSPVAACGSPTGATLRSRTIAGSTRSHGRSATASAMNTDCSRRQVLCFAETFRIVEPVRGLTIHRLYEPVVQFLAPIRQQRFQNLPITVKHLARFCCCSGWICSPRCNDAFWGRVLLAIFRGRSQTPSKVRSTHSFPTDSSNRL